jgi:hypothetical protein
MEAESTVEDLAVGRAAVFATEFFVVGELQE